MSKLSPFFRAAVVFPAADVGVVWRFQIHVCDVILCVWLSKECGDAKPKRKLSSGGEYA